MYLLLSQYYLCHPRHHELSAKGLDDVSEGTLLVAFGIISICVNVVITPSLTAEIIAGITAETID